MVKKQQVREILFSGSGALDMSQKETVVAVGVKIMSEMKDRAVIIRAIQTALSDESIHFALAHQVYNFFLKWEQNEKRQVREFIMSELAEVLNVTSAKVLRKADLEDESKAKAVKAQLKSDYKQVKKEIETLLIQKFGDDFDEPVARKLKVKEYAVVRFFREDRVPTRETVRSFLEVLDTNDIKYKLI